jgi:2,3-bisphosphoglycerate-dependent phosphoglycerate mutase
VEPGCVTARLILLRHGESEWNALDLFTGWVDVGLSDKGRAEAVRAGELLRHRRLLPDMLHTSVLRRAIQTSDISLDVCDRHWIPARRSWRLNERHYGALQGRSKRQTRERYGDEQFVLWRRSYDTPPPPLEGEALEAEARDPRYAVIPDELRPRTECLKDVLVRLMPYWYDAIVPDLHDRRLVLVSAHGNSLRALVKHLDGISDSEIVGLNIPTGVPLLYELGADLRPLRRGGEYLDPEAAAASIEAVRNQGRG